MIIGDFVRYVAGDDIDPAYAGREYAAIVTEVDANNPDLVGLQIFWPTFAFVAHRDLFGLVGPPVPRDDTVPPAGDTWHPAP